MPRYETVRTIDDSLGPIYETIDLDLQAEIATLRQLSFLRDLAIDEDQFCPTCLYAPCACDSAEPW